MIVGYFAVYKEKEYRCIDLEGKNLVTQYDSNGLSKEQYFPIEEVTSLCKYSMKAEFVGYTWNVSRIRGAGVVLEISNIGEDESSIEKCQSFITKWIPFDKADKIYVLKEEVEGYPLIVDRKIEIKTLTELLKYK